MTQADRIRTFIVRNFVVPAQAAGRATLSLRAGDVHRMMGLSNMPRAVCSVLRGARLHREASLTLTGQEGPEDGMNVWFHFDLPQQGVEIPKGAPASPPARSAPAPDVRSDNVDLRNALVLISCTKAKLATPAPARHLYSSPAFQMKRQLAEKAGATWLVLSAKHGLVKSDDVIEPYDETLVGMRISDRKAWARRVLPELLPMAKGIGHVVCLAGHRYIEFLVQPLADAGIRVSEPLRGLRQGEQLSWLTKQQ